jgi:hypothetical protein
MFQNKKRKIEEGKKPEKKIKNIIMFDKVLNEYLVEWNDLTRSWQYNIPQEFIIQYREKLMSYIS